MLEFFIVTILNSFTCYIRFQLMILFLVCLDEAINAEKFKKEYLNEKLNYKIKINFLN